MLLLSSMTTATMFCCGRRVAMLNAGCHSRNSSRQTSKLWRIQTTAVRGPRMVGAMARRRLQITQPRPAAASEQQHHQRPHRPLAEKHEAAFGEDSRRIFEEKLKHRIGAYGPASQHIMLLNVRCPCASRLRLQKFDVEPSASLVTETVACAIGAVENRATERRSIRNPCHSCMSMIQ